MSKLTSDIALLVIAEQFGTPLYVYDSRIIQAQYAALKSALAGSAEIFYSLKANPAIAVAAQLCLAGAGAEIASITELEVALAAGFAPQHIIFAGPSKTSAILARIIPQDLGAIVCESYEEFQQIVKLATACRKLTRVLLRVNPAFPVRQASLHMGGVASQFGMDEAWLMPLQHQFMPNEYVKIVGLHVFCATRILDADVFLYHTEQILSLATRWSNAWRLPISLLDIGGGIGVPLFAGEASFDLQKVNQKLPAMLNIFRARHAGVRIILESGRYLVAEAGVFITRIIASKKSQGKHFLITDGGMHCHLSAAGYGTVLQRNFPLKLLTKRSPVGSGQQRWHIVGPLCTPADVIGRNVEWADAQCGDCVMVEKSGAYGATASPGHFLGYGFPAEVILTATGARLIRQRDSPDDILRAQRFILKQEINHERYMPV